MSAREQALAVISTMCTDRTAEAVLDALRPFLVDLAIEAGELKQYGSGWHYNRFTGELEPMDDDGMNRLYLPAQLGQEP